MSHPFQEGGGGTLMSYLFLGEGDPLRTHREGLRRWAGINPILVGRLLSKDGWGDRDESFKRGVSQGRRGGFTNHIQGEGWGADYVNEYAKCLHFYSNGRPFINDWTRT